MTTEIKIPAMPASVDTAVVSVIRVEPGQEVTKNQNLVDIETNKIVLELVAPYSGKIESIYVVSGESVVSEQVIMDMQKCETIPPEESTKLPSKPQASGLRIIGIVIAVLVVAIATYVKLQS